MNDWISVKDRLPNAASEDKEAYEEYNVYCENNENHEPIVTTLDFTEHGWCDQNHGDWNSFVTRWMPLPEPPTKQ